MVEIGKHSEGSTVTLQVKGEVDASSSLALDQAIKTELTAHTKVLLFDLSELDYISSAGLGVFMSYLEDFRDRNMASALFGLSPKVRQVFDILGLDQLMTISDTKEDALAAVQ